MGGSRDVGGGASHLVRGGVEGRNVFRERGYAGLELVHLPQVQGVEHPNKRVGSFSGKKSHPKKEGTVALVCGS